MRPAVSICWLRRDLRLHDNIALTHALGSPDPVVCVFIFDRDILDRLPSPGDRRVAFIWKVLHGLNEQLIKKGSSLVVLYDKPLQAFQDLSNRFEIRALFVNHDYEPYAIERDRQVEMFVRSLGAVFNSFRDQVIFEKDEILKADGRPYTVYTPYLNAWMQKHLSQQTDSGFVEIPQHFFQMRSIVIPAIESMGFEMTDTPGITANIDETILKDYGGTRNNPAIEGTSRLSVHLRFGTVSIRQLVKIALKVSIPWLRELVWREFFMMILYHFPFVVSQSFKSRYDNIKWRNNEAEFEKWCRGETGYPIVDAGMRQLNSTGWMHNRIRMVVASFLVKHLLVDWRWGEAYFAEKLIDYDLAVNNGNWQWVTGSGCDAAPYFRIFNPVTQQEKFDPGFIYIRKWMPDYRPGYLPLIVDHAFARKRAMDVYGAALTR